MHEPVVFSIAVIAKGLASPSRVALTEEAMRFSGKKHLIIMLPSRPT